MCEIELIYLIEAFGALWMLSFDKENQDIMLQTEAVMEALVNSRKSQNKKIEKSCSGALWNMREKLSAIEKYKDLGKLSKVLLLFYDLWVGENQPFSTIVICLMILSLTCLGCLGSIPLTI